MKFPNTGLYAITPTGNKSIADIVANVAAALKGGASVIQYRDKNPTNEYQCGKNLLKVCHDYHVPLIINDNIDLAVNIGADGVHLGKFDGKIADARLRLGKHAIIGVSCYNSLELAVAAENNTATYVAFGRFFPSDSKPLASPADIATLHKARQQIKLPIVAIGGILPGNGKQLLNAGADLLAVIGGVFNHEPEQSARDYCTLFSK